jgi:hypothetical protein
MKRKRQDEQRHPSRADMLAEKLENLHKRLGQMQSFRPLSSKINFYLGLRNLLPIKDHITDWWLLLREHLADIDSEFISRIVATFEQPDDTGQLWVAWIRENEKTALYADLMAHARHVATKRNITIETPLDVLNVMQDPDTKELLQGVLSTITMGEVIILLKYLEFILFCCFE